MKTFQNIFILTIKYYSFLVRILLLFSTVCPEKHGNCSTNQHSENDGILEGDQNLTMPGEFHDEFMQ